MVPNGPVSALNHIQSHKIQPPNRILRIPACTWISRTLRGSRLELTASLSPQPLCSPQSHTCTCSTTFHTSNLHDHLSPSFPSSPFLPVLYHLHHLSLSSLLPSVCSYLLYPFFWLFRTQDLETGWQTVDGGLRAGGWERPWYWHIGKYCPQHVPFLLLGPDTSFYYSLIPATILTCDLHSITVFLLRTPHEPYYLSFPTRCQPFTVHRSLLHSLSPLNFMITLWGCC